jgi:2',3'-cyclic-nucleotide 2'-phosphodiesterase (5'-nucleotidase family)
MAGRAEAGRERAPTDSLVILHTNDIHSWLAPFEREDGAQAGGAAARAALVARERRGAKNTLLLDAGDVFQGTPYFIFFRGVPDYRTMSAMRYDLGTLGNHDLDLGPIGWLQARPDARFDLVSANVFAAAESSWARTGPEVPREARRGARWIGGKKVPKDAALSYLAPPYAMRTTRSGIRIAIFGLVTKDLSRIAVVPPNRGVAVGDPVAVTRQLLPRLRREADLVIAVSHMGVKADSMLAIRVPGIDVIIGGHSHTRLYHPIRVRNGPTKNGWAGTVIAQAGWRGEYLGRTVIYFDGARPIRFNGSLLPVGPSGGEDPEVAALLRPYTDSMSVRISRPVFLSPEWIPATGLRQGETPLGDFVADVLREAGDADVGFMNSGGIRAPIPAGQVTVGDVYSTLPFSNRIVVVTMPGWQLRELFDFTAARLGKGGFAQISGAKYVIHGTRSSYVRVGGEILDSNRSYRVATVDYLYDGGDGYTLFSKAGPAQETGILLRDAAVEFLLAHPDYRFEKQGRIVWEGSMRPFR